MFANVIDKFGKTTTFAVVGVILFSLISLSFGVFSSSGGVVVLYSGLDNTDKYNIVRLLNQIGAEYTLSEDSVMVNPDKVREYRMYLAAEGVPNGGTIVGYEIFNKEDAFSTSSFTQNVNLLRALEGEISRTIMSFEHIKTARVHLALPKREPFSRVTTESSASVILKLKKSTSLTKKEADAISHFIASAVAGLKPENVTILSTDGYALKLPSSGEDVSFSNHEYKLEVERHLRSVIEDLVGRSLGVGKVRAEVSLELDFDRVITNSQTYDPSSQTLRSNQSSEEHSKSSSPEGEVSIANNIPTGTGDKSSSGASALDKTEETNNYEISKEEKKYIKGIGAIRKMSIAVLVDGDYINDVATGKDTYVPKNSDALMQIRSLVVSAIGFEPTRGDRIEVINMKFSKEIEEEDFNNGTSLLTYQIDRMLVAALIFLFSALFSFFIFKPIVIKFLDKHGHSFGKGSRAEENEAAMEVELNKSNDSKGEARSSEEDGGEDYIKRKAAAITEELNTFIYANASSAVTLLRRLIKESE